MNYLTLNLSDGDLVLSDNSVWKSLHTWLDGGTLYADYYDASNCGDYWSASVHWINIDSNSTHLSFTIEYEFINATATDSCLCQIKFDELSDGVAVTADATGLNILNARISKHIDCNYSNANIKIDITVNLLTKEITTYIHKDQVSLAKTVNASNYSFTKFLIQAGSRGDDVYRLPTTTKLLDVSVSDAAISYNNFSEILNYVDKRSLAKIWTNIKNYITAQLLGKSNTGHTHAKISGGTTWSDGGTLETFSSEDPSYAGCVNIQPALTDTTFKTMTIQPTGTWTWNGSAVQVTSDQRLKQQISNIDDKLLDAWEDVELSQFKYNDAVDTKEDKARLHTGYVVQQIDKACQSHGVDISAYGLFCHEEYPEETAEIEVEQEDGTKTKERKVIREANEHYSLRYTEAYAVECKYLRRCIARLTARIEELEKENNVK